MSNMERLVAFLMHAKIPFEVRYPEYFGQEPQLLIPSAEKRDQGGDVVCHNFSYGGPQGLLETMGFGLEDVQGYLYAEEAFTIILDWWEKKNQKGG